MNQQLKFELFDMYNELISQSLQVVLVPASKPMFSGHKIRLAVNHNPQWYRELCACYISNCKSHKNRGKIDTKIKRQAVLNFLLDPYKYKNFKYANDLINIAQIRLNDYESQSYVPF